MRAAKANRRPPSSAKRSRPTSPRSRPADRLPSFSAAFDSGFTDTAERHEEILFKPVFAARRGDSSRRGRAHRVARSGRASVADAAARRHWRALRIGRSPRCLARACPQRICAAHPRDAAGAGHDPARSRVSASRSHWCARRARFRPIDCDGELGSRTAPAGRSVASGGA